MQGQQFFFKIKEFLQTGRPSLSSTLFVPCRNQLQNQFNSFMVNTLSRYVYLEDVWKQLTRALVQNISPDSSFFQQLALKLDNLPGNILSSKNIRKILQNRKQLSYYYQTQNQLQAELLNLKFYKFPLTVQKNQLPIHFKLKNLVGAVNTYQSFLISIADQKPTNSYNQYKRERTIYTKDMLPYFQAIEKMKADLSTFNSCVKPYRQKFQSNKIEATDSSIIEGLFSEANQVKIEFEQTISLFTKMIPFIHQKKLPPSKYTLAPNLKNRRVIELYEILSREIHQISQQLTCKQLFESKYPSKLYQRLEKENHELLAQIKPIKEQLEKEQERVNELTNQIEKKKIQIERNEKEIIDHRQSIAELKKQLQNHQQQRGRKDEEELQRLQKQQKQWSQQLQKQRQRQQQQKRIWQQQLQKQQQKLKQLQRQRKQQKQGQRQRQRQLTLELQNIKEKYQEAKDFIQKLTIQRTELKIESNNIHEINMKIQSELQDLTYKQKKEVEDNKIKVEGEIGNLTQQLYQLKQNLKMCMLQLTKCQDQIKSMRQQKNAFIQDYIELHEKYYQLLNQQLEKSIVYIKSQQQNSNSEINNFSSFEQAQNTKVMVNQLQKQMKDMKQQYQDQISRLKSHENVQASNLSQLTATNFALSKEIKELKAQIYQREKQDRDDRLKMDGLNKQLIQNQAEIQKQKQQLDRCQEKKQMCIQELQNCKEKNKSLEADNVFLNQQYQKLNYLYNQQVNKLNLEIDGMKSIINESFRKENKKDDSMQTQHIEIVEPRQGSTILERNIIHGKNADELSGQLQAVREQKQSLLNQIRKCEMAIEEIRRKKEFSSTNLQPLWKFIENMQQILCSKKSIHKEDLSIQQSCKSSLPSMVPFSMTLFSCDIFWGDQSSKDILINHLEKYAGRRISRTALLFKYHPLHKQNYMVYLDNIQSIALVVKTKSATFAAFYPGVYKDQKILNEGGLLISVTNNKSYRLKEKKDSKQKVLQRAMIYDIYHLVFGNSDIQIKILQKKIYSSFGYNHSSFDCQGDKVDKLLGEGDNRLTEFECCELYQVSFEKEGF